MASSATDREHSLESVIVFRTAHGLEGRGTLLHLTRHSVTFEVYNPYSIVQLSEVLDELKILRDTRPIYQGRGVVTSLVPTGALNIVSATLIDAWTDLHGLFEGDAIRAEVERFVRSWERGYRLRAEYQFAVSRIANFLQELSRWLGQAEALSASAGKTNVEEELFEHVWSPLHAKLSELFAQFEQEAPQLSREETPVHRAFAQRELHPLVMCDPFFHRSFVKPLGYAGDYQMVRMILGESDPTTEAAAPPPTHDSSAVSHVRSRTMSTYARVLNAFNLGAGPSAAHRNRIQLLEQLLTQEARRVRATGRPLRVLDVGCGPASELERFIAGSELSQHCVVTLIDFNEETLEYAHSKLMLAMQKAHRKVNVRAVELSIHDLLRAAARNDSAFRDRYDFVYCAGLFDYLSDRVCRRLLRLYLDWIAPGALLVATNVRDNNPIRYYMEHVAEWYLEHRSEAQFQSLAPEGTHARVYSDATGINLFLEIRKRED
jgi:extracellular factor (EF) 3-hydroxypalmitic acid methyl ester biosynthesis protein